MAFYHEQSAHNEILPVEVSDIVLSDPYLTGRTIVTVEPILGGVAHHVYKLQTEDEILFLKIRGDHFATIPSIACNPNDIAIECEAIRQFGDASPEHFPQIRSFNPDKHYLIITDVIGHGVKFEKILLSGEIPVEIFSLYGKTLRTLRDRTTEITTSIRPDGDDSYYHTILDHRLGYRHHPILDQAVIHLSDLPSRQLIHADPAPKNMGYIKLMKRLTFFDLETAHIGNPEFDYAYGLAHTILHTLPSQKALRHAVYDYVTGYGETGYDTQLIYQITLGLILYRIKSIIPYPVALSASKKERMEKTIDQYLFTITGYEPIEDILSLLSTI